MLAAHLTTAGSHLGPHHLTNFCISLHFSVRNSGGKRGAIVWDLQCCCQFLPVAALFSLKPCEMFVLYFLSLKEY